MILDPRSGRLRNAYSVTFDEEVPGLTPGPQEGIRGGRDAELTPGAVVDAPVTPRPISPSMQEHHAGHRLTMQEGEPEAPYWVEEEREELAQDMGAEENENSNNQEHQCPRRSTRMRCQFDPNHIPSGTREMEILTQQVEEDSLTNSDEEDQLSSFALCMAMTTHPGDEEPKSWKRAIDATHWKEAMMREKK